MHFEQKARDFMENFKKIHYIFLGGLIINILFLMVMFFIFGIVNLRTPILFIIFVVLLLTLGILSKPMYNQILALRNYKEVHFGILSGEFVGINLLNWILFFFKVINLHGPIIFTIFTVILIFATFLMKSKQHKIIAKIVYIGFGGFALGILIWFIAMYVFISAPWAPFSALKGPLSLYFMLIALILGALMGYAIGKKRTWKTRFTQNN